MVICADTSFLFSLYGNDSHSKAATEWALQATSPISVTGISLFEVENALRFSASRGFIPERQCFSSLDLMKGALDAKRLRPVACNLADVVQRARAISGARTIAGGHRAFDILHVATALEIGADLFLTFDRNQQALARAEGLNVPF